MVRTAQVLADSSEPRAESEPKAVLPDLQALYSEHASFLWRVLRGMGVHEATVADAVQDIFLIVHRRYPAFDHRVKVRTWLFEIAYRVASDCRRKQSRASRLFTPHEDNVPSPDGSPAETLQRHEHAELLTRLLAKLDDDKRLVLVLSDIEGLTAVEIAELSGAPLNTVYSRLRRARTEFSQLVSAHERSLK